MWGDDTIQFDQEGKPLVSSTPVSFTLSGVEIKKAEIKQGKLQLHGRRVGIELASGSPVRVPLLIGTSKSHHDEEIYFEIAGSPAGDYTAALDKIFTKDLKDLVPSLPAHWQGYVRKSLLNEDLTYDPLPRRSNPVVKLGKDVTPPSLVSAVEPEFNQYAKLLKYQGVVILHFIVEQHGRADHISIKKGLGLGLDEEALNNVKQYAFIPASRRGVPVPSEIDMEVKFEIY
jgi:TonB family protein